MTHTSSDDAAGHDIARPRPIDFLQLMEVVSKAMSTALGDDGISAEEEFHRARQMAEVLTNQAEARAAERGIEIPPTLRPNTVQALDTLEGVLKAPRSDAPGLHPVVCSLLSRNWEYLKATHGIEIARQVFSQTTRAFTRKPRGRPHSTPLSNVVAARGRHKHGESYSTIARTETRTRDQVRNAIRYAYRKK